MRRRLAWKIVAPAMAALVLAGCTWGASEPASASRATAIPPLAGLVNVGVGNDLPGAATLTPGANLRAGFDIDLVRWLGQNLPGHSFDPTFVDTPIAERQSSLQSGRVRMVVEVFSITDERRRTMDFAGPYLITQQGALVRSDDTSVTDVNSFAGKTVCAPTGSTSVQQLPQVLQDKIILRQEPGNSSCVDLLTRGQVDIVSTDQLILDGFARADPRVRVLPDLKFGSEERYGVGLPDGDAATCEDVTQALSRFIAGGSWNQFFLANFPGLDPAAYKPDPYALDRCEPPTGR
jgi:glutamate transport system substrate-binding protein